MWFVSIYASIDPEQLRIHHVSSQSATSELTQGDVTDTHRRAATPFGQAVAYRAMYTHAHTKQSKQSTGLCAKHHRIVGALR